MKVTNTNKRFTVEQIREVIRFTRPPGISNFTVKVKNSSYLFAGRAYWDGCSYGDSTGALIVVRINPKMSFPYTYHPPQRRGYLPFKVFTLEEVLVHLLAHELRHLWQAKVKRGRRVWGARGQFSERDADAYAIQKVRQWRRK